MPNFNFLAVVGLVLAVFVFWRNLKEDFDQEEVLTLALLAAVLGFLGFWGFSLLGAFSGVTVAVILWGKKKAWDIWLILEASVVPLLLVFIFGAVGAFLTGKDLKFLILGLLGVLVLVLVKKVLAGYRSFAFYSSGKPGFIFLAAAAVFFSFLLGLAFWQRRVLKLETIGESLLVLGSLGFLYRRAERKMKNPIVFPKNILEPVRTFLTGKLGELEKRKKELVSQDPFADTARLKDNAASDADAAEQVGHTQIEAIKKEIDRKLIQIRKALTQIKIGKYGICEKCGRMIDTDRLMVFPEATICVNCEKKREKS